MARVDDDNESPTEFRPNLSGRGRVPSDAIEIDEEEDAADGRDHAESGDLEAAAGRGYADDEESLADRVRAVMPRDRSSPLGEDVLLLNRVDADRIDLDTDGQVRSHNARVGRKLLTRALPIALLVGVTAWSLYEISGLDKPMREPKPTVEVIKSAAVVPEDAHGPASAVVAEEPEEPVLGKRIGRLLEGVELERVKSSEFTETITLSKAVVEDGVTVINLWGTWCPPCKRELPGLKDLFARGKARWGDKVRFVPIRLDDVEDAGVSYDKFVEKMPATDYFLSDYADHEGGVREPLVAAEIIKKKQSLPVTIVLDCRQSIRWHHAGEIKDEAFAELEKKIDELRQAPASYCRKKKPKPKDTVSGGSPEKKPETPVATTAVVKAPASSCGDGKCGAKEDCHECPKDCGCPSGQPCKKRSETQCPPGKPCKQIASGWFCKEGID
jgi:thiol-disulfide isomerase/thioredoxin